MPQNKKFHKEAGFIRKIDEIATEAELNQQLSEYGRRGKHSILMVDDFKKRPDRGFDVWIFRSKAN
ncbi:hypothetical protein RhiirA1_467245 [Rhizophagus irregularis]|uniref:Uncharacterized protein n=1 Tax=Rhizophagus irregularis TaxID=588596 RepID=A0A2N0RCE4_9GLOM|nr:hypothetical protein RhiirA1_467245 [Rhizophagus irregularis]